MTKQAGRVGSIGLVGRGSIGLRVGSGLLEIFQTIFFFLITKTNHNNMFRENE